VPNDAEQSQKKDMRDYGKRTQKKPGTDPKQVAFNLLLTMVIVFCILPFYIVENAWFRFLIFFLDATFSIPSRKGYHPDSHASVVPQNCRGMQ
jgi:hypothetical protein